MTGNEAVAALLKETRENRAILDKIAAHLGIGTRAPAQASGTAPASGQVADDRDLDGDHGNPVVKYGLKEKYWPNQPDENIGNRFSECSPEYLEATAKYLDSCAYAMSKDSPANPAKGYAAKAADPVKAGYKAKDAARARGHAARIRAQGPSAPAAPQQTADDIEIPF